MIHCVELIAITFSQHILSIKCISMFCIHKDWYLRLLYDVHVISMYQPCNFFYQFQEKDEYNWVHKDEMVWLISFNNTVDSDIAFEIISTGKTKDTKEGF